MMMDFIKNTVLVLVVLVFSTLIAEVSFRIYYSFNLDYQIEMSRYAAELKRVASDQRMFHEHRPNSEAVLMGVPIRINGHGFRGPGRLIAKKENTWRVFMLGDSITLGWGVRENDRFSVLLENLINEELSGRNSPNRVEIINSGIGNYNTAQEVALFENKGLDWCPDFVVLNYFINDAEPTPRKRSPKAISYSYLAMWMWGRLDILKRLYEKSATYSYYYRALYEDGREGLVELRNGIMRLGELASSKKFTYIISILPELHSVEPDYQFTDVHDKVKKMALGGHPDSIIDLTPYFVGETPSKLWVSADDAHPNEYANKIIANGLLKDFQKLDYLDRLAVGKPLVCN